MRNSNRAFTLIELLVVIAIIGLLSSVVLGSLSAARAKARDAQRVGDLRSVVTALEMYRATHGRYPASAGSTVLDPRCGGAGWCLATTISNDLIPGGFMSNVPADPTQANGGYNYRYCGGGASAVVGVIGYSEKYGGWCRMQMAGGLPTTCGSAPNTWDTFPICN